MPVYKQKGLVRIELTILIVIICLVLLVSLGAYLSARGSARDRQRIIDVGVMQKALQDYWMDNGFYPYGSNTSLPSGIAQYVSYWPVAPSPGGGCTDLENGYAYSQQSNGTDYSLTFCLGHKTTGLAAGAHTLTSTGIQ